jgi:hypothetical protein
MQHVLWLLTLMCSVALLWIDGEWVLGNWTPISSTLAPLALRTSVSGSAALIGVTALFLYRSVTRIATWADWALWVAIALAALANSFPALIVGVGLIDVITVVEAYTAQRPLRLTHVIAGLLSTFLLVFAAVQANKELQSSYFPFIQLSERSIAFVLMACTARLIGYGFATPRVRDVLVALPALIILMRVQPISSAAHASVWLVIALLIACVIALAAASLQSGRVMALRALSVVAVLFGAAASWRGTTSVEMSIAYAILAWLCGIVLIDADQLIAQDASTPLGFRVGISVARLVGALLLIGAPFTTGYATQINVWNAIISESSSPLLSAVARYGIGALLFIVKIWAAWLALREWRNKQSPTQPLSNLQSLLAFASLLLVAFIGVGFGILPTLSLDLLLLGVTLLSIAFGALLMWLQQQKEKRGRTIFTETARERLSSYLTGEGWVDLLAGAFRRIGYPLTGVFPFLESDGALLWALVFALVLLLIGRQVGP